MKKFLSLALAAMALVACQKGYTVRGTCGTVDGTAKLSYELPDGTPFSEEAPLVAGSFTFKGEVPAVTPAVVFLTAEGGDPVRATFYLENTRIQLDIDPDKVVDYGRYGGKIFRGVTASGGRSNAFEKAVNEACDEVGRQPEYAALVAAQEELRSMGYADMDAYNAKRDALSRDFEDVLPAYGKAVREATRRCIEQFPDAEAAALTFSHSMAYMSLEELESGFAKFTDKVKESPLAKGIQEEIACRKATQPGAVAPDFTLNDPDGNPVTLSSLRGQYVIVDFWASWCKPCRAGVPGMKELYARYHDKGLEIIGVSDDTKPEAWKKALEEDQTAWIHVIDEFPVKNRPSRVGSLYGVHYIPSYFLLDKEGKVIGKMDHDELAAKLAELLD